MPTCDNCERHVTAQFVRVFADDAGRISACPNCSAKAGIARATLDRR